MERIKRAIQAMVMLFVVFTVMMAICGPAAAATQRFEDEDVAITSKLPPQYIGWTVGSGSTTQNEVMYYRVAAYIPGMGETKVSTTAIAYTTYAGLASTNSLQILWTQVAGASYYKLYRSADDSSYYLIASPTKPEYLDEGAADGAAYSAPSPRGGNLTVENKITVKDLEVTGTLSPYSTGTFTGEGIELDYGISAATGVFTGAVSVGTLNTGQGANELYDMDQNVQQADAVTFASVDTGQGANELYDMDQNVLTSDAVTFYRMALTENISAVSGTFSGGISMGGVLNVTGTVNAAGNMNVVSNTVSGGFFGFNPTSAQEVVQVTPTVSGYSLYCVDCNPGRPIWFLVGTGWLFGDGTAAPW